MAINKSIELFKQAQNHIPAGVNSPVRAFRSVGGNPIFMAKGLGSKIIDVDGNEYIDYIGSWGPHLFGHNPQFIKEAVSEALENGTSFGAPTEIEVKMADLLCELIPSMDMVRMVNSGTEATMSAIRLARGFTGKDKIIKFEGCYHGHGDSFLIKAGSGALTFGVPTSPGVTEGTAKDTIVCTYNDFDSVAEAVDRNKGRIAAVILEPIAGNMGVVPSTPDFLKKLRDLCTSENIVLIFDEVMTGFRVARGGAQEVYGIMPDLSTFGKVIGGGLPVGAFGGKKKIMEFISPLGPVYQAGTLSGNPMAMSAGFAMLREIMNVATLYENLEKKSIFLEGMLKDTMQRLGLNYSINRAGSMMCLFFTESEVIDFSSAIRSDTEKYAKFFHNMLDSGIYLAPSQFEAMFISAAHSEEDLLRTADAAERSLKSF